MLVTQGAAGACYQTGGRLLTRPARAVTVVDPVGAGDAFAAGFLAAYLAGAGPERRLERAVLTGSLVVGVAGDWEGLPTRREVETWTDDDVRR